MRGPGGTEGGLSKFVIGAVLAGLAIYFFLDSVIVANNNGWISGYMGWWGTTTSTGILFVPFVLGVIALFYDARKWWAWWLLYLGFGIIVVEILSRVRFMLQMKATHFLLLLVMFGAGVGLILRSLRDEELSEREAQDDGGPKPRGE
jgi:hypothetical protein